MQKMEADKDPGELGNGDWYWWEDEASCNAIAHGVSGCQAVKIWVMVGGRVDRVIAFHNSSNTGEGNSESSANQIASFIIGTYKGPKYADNKVTVKVLALYNADSESHRDPSAEKDALRVIGNCISRIKKESEPTIDVEYETRWVTTGGNYANMPLTGGFNELAATGETIRPERIKNAQTHFPTSRARTGPIGPPKGHTKEKKGCCFLTTACTEHAGLGDDCVELTALRWFRDNYLFKREDGQALIEEYYRIAPGLVDRINAAPDADRIYEGILGTVKECVNRIETSQWEETLTLYLDMVFGLTRRFAS